MLTAGRGARVINDSERNLKIIVNPKIYLLITIFSLIWFSGWIMGEVFVVEELVTSFRSGTLNLFMVFWGVFWTMSGCFVIGVILWNMFRQETIILSGRTMKIKRKVFALEIKEKYQLQEIKKNKPEKE